MCGPQHAFFKVFCVLDHLKGFGSSGLSFLNSSCPITYIQTREIRFFENFGKCHIFLQNNMILMPLFFSDRAEELISCHFQDLFIRVDFVGEIDKTLFFVGILVVFPNNAYFPLFYDPNQIQSCWCFSKT